MLKVRSGGDAVEPALLFLAEDGVPQAVAPGRDAGRADALAIGGPRVEKRGGRDRERRRRHAEVALDHAVGHLVVVPAADAVDEQIAQAQPREGRQREGAARHAQPPAAQVHEQRVGVAIEVEAGDRRAAAVARDGQPPARGGVEVIKPERQLDFIVADQKIRHRPLGVVDAGGGAVGVEGGVVGGGEALGVAGEVPHEPQPRRRHRQAAHREQRVLQAELPVDLVLGVGEHRRQIERRDGVVLVDDERPASPQELAHQRADRPVGLALLGGVDER